LFEFLEEEEVKKNIKNGREAVAAAVAVVVVVAVRLCF